MVRDLLIEIGVEELPASFIEPALFSLAAQLTTRLNEHEIDFAPPRLNLGTPRRLALLVKNVAQKGRDRVQVFVGPPQKAAFDEQGRPTEAALGFARSKGAAVAELKVVKNDKGVDCVAVEKTIPGLETSAVLAQVLPAVIRAIQFPKTMRWGEGELRFARPIHWLVVLWGDEVVKVEIAGLKSGRTTFGHRFMAPQAIDLAGPAAYVSKLRQAHVVVDREERLDLTRRAAAEAARACGGLILEDEELVQTNADLVELPTATCGGFDEAFLNLPQEVLITAMKEHQKYFAVIDEQSRLRPHFVAVNNTLAQDPNVVRRGHERVLKARLADAEFFYVEDTKVSLRSRLKELKNVVYQRDLGTSFDKVQRFANLGQWLLKALAAEGTAEFVEDPARINALVRDTAELSKCDLVTQMVGEFPSLQGVVGSAYAAKEGQDPLVIQGIREHYLPDSAEAPLPQSLTGSLVSLADKMDTIVGLFAINKPPTGAADPFGLRRAALGIIRLLIGRGWRLKLSEFIDRAVEELPESVFKPPRQGVKAAVFDFFRGRMLHLFTGQGFDHDVVEAVLEEHGHIPGWTEDLVAVVQAYKQSPQFNEGAIAFKRLFNILKGQSPPQEARPELFTQDEERALHRAAVALRGQAHTLADRGHYQELLERLTALKPSVDKFFDEVLVMTDDEALRANRLALVKEVADLFRLVADFSRLQTG